jgi:hypothetical protein
MNHRNILKINDVFYEKTHRHSHKPPVIYLCLDLMDSDLHYLVEEKEYTFSPYRLQHITK